ncbi:hypothetical protein [Marinobacterium sedimentorum]|uniref:hypothetical protein n=1 Tax=Marinobacterium sedimentorum TaxID=2927804 RepID=UPI0020C602E2|nr:hypothetical protein [Marinobacterium sedimentorum]MCP8689864.1 hypothetical protein [Marinobacterium sedimentorum]
MVHNPHFETAADWAQAAALVDFEPRRPAFTAGFALQSLAVHVMDHRKRRLPVSARSLEAHYGGFVIDQKRASCAAQARHLALSRPHGRAPATVQVAGQEGRSYALGPVPESGDIDGRSPAVVVWHEGDRVYLVASDQLEVATLLRIAVSLYD